MQEAQSHTTVAKKSHIVLIFPHDANSMLQRKIKHQILSQTLVLMPLSV